MCAYMKSVSTGAILKEAIEDLEWAAADGSVRILLKRDPGAVSLSGNSSGSLDIALPVSFPSALGSSLFPDFTPYTLVQVEQLHGFSCAETEVCHWFKYKHLRAAVANLPHPKDAAAQASSKVGRCVDMSAGRCMMQTYVQVTIDSQGLLKITHMLSLQTPAKSQAGTYQARMLSISWTLSHLHSHSDPWQGMAAFNASQLLNQGNTGIVTFMLLPVEQMQGEDSA